MNDHALSLAIAHAIAPEVAVKVYAHDTLVTEDGSGNFTLAERAGIELPNVLIECESEGLAGSRSVCRARVRITLESLADEDSAEVHAARVAVVAGIMAEVAALDEAAEAAGGTVGFCGRPALQQSDVSGEKRAFITVLPYVVGYAL